MTASYRKNVILIAALLFGASAASAQITIGPPVNAGSYFQAGLPGSGIAQGSLFVIFGSQMTSGSITNFASGFPLPTTLNGTAVSVTVGSTTVQAFINIVSAGYIAAILPSSTPTGAGTVKVTSAGKVSNTAAITVVPSAFGALTYNQSGTGPAVIFNNSQSGQPVNNLLTAAAPGEVAELWGTGLGALPGGNDANPPAQTNAFGAQTQVFVGGVASPQVQYAGRSTFAGVDQINFVIPSGVSGCWVPVYVVINGVSSNVSTMAIATSDGACTDPTGLSSSDISVLQSGKANFNVGVIAATHYSVNFNLAAFGGAVSGTFDQLQAQFSHIPSYDIPFTPGLASQGSPSLGYCVVGQFTFDGSILDSIGGGNVNYPFNEGPLAAGTILTISGAAGTDQIAESPALSGSYKAQLGGINTSGGAPTPTYFNPGTFSINNGSGEAVGAFSTKLTIPAIMSWTNEPTPGAAISRSQNLIVNWTGASASGEFVTILGTSANTTTNAAVSFQCTVPSALGTFTVPSSILSMLPASGASNGDKVGFLIVSQQPLRSGTSFSASGMDLGYIFYQEALAVNVVYQ